MPARRIWCLSMLLAVLVAGCGSGAVPTSPPSPSDPPAASALPSLAVTALPDPSASTDPLGPPAALLSVEGGDPVTGQLGTYTWGDTGSDAPWLQGSPITVGTGEVLTMSFDRPADVERWEARLVPAGADGPGDGRTAGSGTGLPRLAAPAAGTMTLALEIAFADGQGRALYAWLLDVR